MRVLYIDIDSARPDHLGCYGYDRPTSPVIDEIAASGTVFTNAHVSDNPCNPSRASLFSARFGIQNGVVGHVGPAQHLRYAGEGHFHDPAAPMWMRHLQERGWNTVSFSGFAQRHLSWWFTAGFTEFHGNKLSGGSESAAEVNDLVEPWLRENATGDDWFLHVNYWDVHFPYDAPEQYRRRIQNGAEPAFPNDATIRRDHDYFYGPHTARDWRPEALYPGITAEWPGIRPAIRDRDDFMYFCNGHDAGISYVDDCIGRLLAILDEQGIAEDTTIIIAADHGENIGEQGVYWAHANASEGTAHIPLIIRWPGVTRPGTVNDGLLYHLDLPPTMLDLLGHEIPPGWSGESFAPALRGDDWPGRDHLIWGMGIWTAQRAVRTRRHLFIRTLHPGLYNIDRLNLFDLEQDPWQRHNLADSEPDLVAGHDHLLSEWWHSHCTGPGSVRDPMVDLLQSSFRANGGRRSSGPDIDFEAAHFVAYLREQGRPEQAADLARRRGLPT